MTKRKLTGFDLMIEVMREVSEGHAVFAETLYCAWTPEGAEGPAYEAAGPRLHARHEVEPDLEEVMTRFLQNTIARHPFSHATRAEAAGPVHYVHLHSDNVTSSFPPSLHGMGHAFVLLHEIGHHVFDNKTTTVRPLIERETGAESYAALVLLNSNRPLAAQTIDAAATSRAQNLIFSDDTSHYTSPMLDEFNIGHTLTRARPGRREIGEDAFMVARHMAIPEERSRAITHELGILSGAPIRHVGLNEARSRFTNLARLGPTSTNPDTVYAAGRALMPLLRGEPMHTAGRTLTASPEVCERLRGRFLEAAERTGETLLPQLLASSRLHLTTSQTEYTQIGPNKSSKPSGSTTYTVIRKRAKHPIK